MGVFGGPEIPNDGLVLALDAGNPRNFNLTAVEVLVVAGGGGGGASIAGGGGAGGLIYSSIHTITPGSAITATVGDGGVGGVDQNIGNGIVANNTNGGNSVFGSLIAIGGGKGGPEYNGNGFSGGSGGGGSRSSGTGNTIYIGGTSTTSQGNSGGTGSNTGGGDGLGSGGGGGGAGSVGGNAAGGTGGSGVSGLSYSISGTSVTYAAGGGGGAYNGTGGSGGSSIGGNGANGSGSIAGSGVNGTGSGGGAGGYPSYRSGAAGGSGIIIVRYPGPQKAIGGTVTSVGGYTIHTFTTSGNFTPLVNTNGSAVLGLSDLSGNRNFGTSVNGVTYSSANGGSLSFDGYDDYIQTNLNYPLTSSTTEFTCAAWYKCFPEATSSGLIFSNYQVAPIPFNLYANVNGKATGVTRNSGSSSVSVISLTSVNDSRWHYVVYTKTGSDTYKLYVDGNLEATATASLGAISVSNTIVLGILNYYLNQGRYRGDIATAQIYNRALSAAEISQNYNALRGRFGI